MKRKPSPPFRSLSLLKMKRISNLMDLNWMVLVVVTLSFIIGETHCRVQVPNDCLSSNFENGLSLVCTLSAINSANEKTNFSVAPSEHTITLTVRCRDSTLSKLEPGGFQSLRNLKKLTLEDCQLRNIPSGAFNGLRKLTSLKIKTRNTGVLTIEDGAFKGLNKLEYLDLTENRIRHISSKTICSLTRLMGLNLSKNQIANLPDFKRISECIPQIRSLDISNNMLSNVDDISGLRTPKLQELKLNNNQISQIKSNVLKLKQNLRFINLANNFLTSLSEKIFQNNFELNRIELANNSLNNLPSRVFIAQNQSLEYLDLSGNHLTSLNSQPFKELSQLTYLDLSRNKLFSNNIGSAFRQLSSLKTLKLDLNKLTRAPILEIESLISLSISHNNLQGKLAPFRLLSNVPKLRRLVLSFNQIEELPKQFFINNTKLTILDLSHNLLKGDVPFTINYLRNLQTLDIGYNDIDNLSNLKVPTLWRFQGRNLRLNKLDANQLNGLPSIIVLDLSANSISRIEMGTFDRFQKLQAIRLDENRLQRMEGLFHNLPQLAWLNVSANEISNFDYAMIPKNLRVLDIFKNKLTGLENQYDTGDDNPYQLTHIDASFNQISKLGPQNLPHKVETLLLNDNNIESLAPYTFFKTTNIMKVDLSVNRLESIDRNALRLSSPGLSENGIITTLNQTLVIGGKQQPKFFLGGNPIRCDCHMAWFKDINNIEDISSMNSFPIVPDLEGIYCQLLYSRERSYVPLVDARSDEFLCSYKTHCYALCHCCDYDACDCEMTCPDNCTCYHITSWKRNIAECSNANFHELPDQLPMDATEIFLDGNNISQLHSHTFIGRKNLKILYLNNSLLTAVENNTFNGLTVLEELHLEGNLISELQGDEFHSLVHLRELYLQDNRISSVNNATFSSLVSLQVLNLQNNRIGHFPVWQFRKNPSLRSIRLAGNTWSCECKFVAQYQKWAQNALVRDISLITCNDATNTRLIDINTSGCEVADTSDLIQHHQQQKDLSLSSSIINSSDNEEIMGSRPNKNSIFRDFLPIFLGILSAIILVLVLIIGIFLYRDELRIWLYSKYGIRFFHRIDGVGDDLDKLFDAFIVHSAKDDAFVRQVLAPELEVGDQQFKLCLFHRDLQMRAPMDNGVGEVHHSYMADAIVQTTEMSKRTILVLSEAFLCSEWSRYDFKSGILQALRLTGRRDSANGKQLIVITMGHVASRRDLDPDLRLYLKTGLVLQWGDKLFWQKLRYALPDNTQTRILQYPHHHMSAFSPDNSFRYETYYRTNSHQSNGGGTMMTTSRSLGGGSSSTYQSVGTPDEQDSTRTMSLHI